MTTPAQKSTVADLKSRYQKLAPPQASTLTDYALYLRSLQLAKDAIDMLDEQRRRLREWAQGWDKAISSPDAAIHLVILDLEVLLKELEQ